MCISCFTLVGQIEYRDLGRYLVTYRAEAWHELLLLDVDDLTKCIGYSKEG